MGQKKFGDSRVMLDAMLKTNPGSPDVLFQLGVVNLAENQFKEAEDAFRRAYQLNPANSRGLMGIVETNMAQNKTDEALKILQAESDKAPNRLDLLLAMGNTAVRAGKYDFAIQTFNKACSARRRRTPSRAIFTSYRRDLPAQRRCQRRHPGVAEGARNAARQHRGAQAPWRWCWMARNANPRPRQVYEATLKLDPNNGVALNNLAFLLAETGGNLDDALTKAQRAKQLLPSLYEISDTLGWIYLKKNLADQAIDIFKDLVVKEPNHSTYRYHLGIAYSQKGDKTQALDQLREALKYNPTKDEKDQIQQLIARLG